jgi:hypothetical protein
MKIKATEISCGAFGLSKKLIYLTGHGRRNYAQYTSVPFYTYVEKGKRTALCRTISGEPLTVILDGWREDIDVPSGFSKSEQGSMIVTSSRFASFAPEYKTEAREFFEALRLQQVPMLIDFERGTIAPALEVANAANT